MYLFLKCCEGSPLDKEVLDCGAGGKNPPLSVFKEFGYKTHGIEISDKSLSQAREFCEARSLELGIEQGDMRRLPFADNSISFVYSYNSVFHMKKADIGVSISEMLRVLKKDGICYINLLSIDDCGCGEGEMLGEGEYLQTEDGRDTIHSYYGDEEGDKYFEDFETLVKQKRIVNVKHDGEVYRLSFIDYIVKKV